MPRPGPVGLLPITGPLRAPTTTAARPRPGYVATRAGQLYITGGQAAPGEWGPAAFTLSASANISAAGADTTTARLTTPGGTFAAGRRVDDSGSTPTTSIAATGYTEHEWSIEATAAAATSDVYEFRVIRADGIELAAYTVTPQWTIGSGIPTTNAPATSAPVSTTAAGPAAQVNPQPPASPVSLTAQAPAAQVRPGATSAAATTTGQPATAAIGPSAQAGTAAVTASNPTVTVLAQAGVAAVSVAAPTPTVSAVGAITDDFNRTDSADLGTNWTPVAGAMRIDTNAAYAGTLGSTAGVLHRERWDGTGLAGPDMAVQATIAQLSTGGYSDLRIMARWTGSTSFYELRIDNSGTWTINRVTAGGETDITSGTGLTLALPEVWRLEASGTGAAVNLRVYRSGSLIGSYSDTAGSRITTGTTGGVGGFTAGGSPPDIRLDDWSLAPLAGAVEASAAGGPVSLTAPAPAVTIQPAATGAAPALTALAPLAMAAAQATAAGAAVASQPAAITVRASAGVAAVVAQGQAATVNTSASTSAAAGVAAVGVAGQTAAGAVRPAAASAPVGAAGLFDAGSLPVLQLVMDNPVLITVTAANATVTTSAGPTSANAGSAPVALAAPAPAGQVRATAGVAAVSTAGQAATTSTASSTSANAGGAPVAIQAPAPIVTVRAAAGVAAVAAAALAPSVQVGNQVLAQAGVAAVSASAASTSSTVRPSASEAACSTAGLASLAPVRPAAGTAVAAVSAAGPLVRVGLRPTPATVIALAFTALGGPSSPTFVGGLNMLLQIQTLTRVRPAQTTDAYGNTVLDYGPAATRTTIPGWVWQASRREGRPDGRGPAEQVWELMCSEPDLDTDDRIEWSSGNPAGPLVFAIEGPPQPSYRAGNVAGAQGFHHTEATMRLVEG